jgi:hypothetical protein
MKLMKLLRRTALSGMLAVGTLGPLDYTAGRPDYTPVAIAAQLPYQRLAGETYQAQRAPPEIRWSVGDRHMRYDRAANVLHISHASGASSRITENDSSQYSHFRYNVQDPIVHDPWAYTTTHWAPRWPTSYATPASFRPWPDAARAETVRQTSWPVWSQYTYSPTPSFSSYVSVLPPVLPAIHLQWS